VELSSNFFIIQAFWEYFVYCSCCNADNYISDSNYTYPIILKLQVRQGNKTKNSMGKPSETTFFLQIEFDLDISP